VERFAAELAELGGHFTRCTTGTLAGEILAKLESLEADVILTWEGNHLPSGLLAELAASGVYLSYRTEAPELNPPPSVGLTGTLGAAASTGTLALTGGEGRPLSASLLPEVHLAVLHEKDIHANLEAVLRSPEIRECSSAVLISGPSRTADIEMTLTIGVHGPREVHVFCVG
jgi:L-lactate dehydrogenase complex protein LldG